MKTIMLVMATIIVLAGSAMLGGSTQQPSAPAPSGAPLPKAEATAVPKTDAAPAPKAAEPAAAKTTQPTATSQDGPKRGQTLRISVLGQPSSYDSHSDTTMKIHTHGAAVFSSLVRTDPMKEDVTVENMIPDLAEKWQISPDNKTYTFSLRKGVKFHDGKPFTSADVKYSLDKYRDSKRSAFAKNVEAIQDIQIVDDFTIKMTLKYEFPEVLIFLSAPYASIYPAHLKDVDPKTTAFLVGTGPFKFKQLVPGKVATFERNPDYFLQGLPYLDTYEVYYMNVSAIADAFTSGQLSLSGSIRELFGTDVPLRENLLKNVQEMKVGSKPVGSTRSIFFGLNREGAWKDLRVRQAMAMVLDYDEALVASRGPLAKQLGYLPSPGIVPYYVREALPKEEVAKIYGIDKPLADRIATAKQLMKEAGYPNGFQAELLSRKGEADHEGNALYAIDMWKKHLNINLKYTPLDAAVLNPRRDKGDFDLIAESTATMTGAVLNEFLGIFLSTDMKNYSKWSNSEYDNLVLQVNRETDNKRKLEFAQKAQRILLQDMPLILIQGTADSSAWRPDLRTGWPNPINGVVQQPLKTAYSSIDRMWFAETPDAARWMKGQ